MGGPRLQRVGATAEKAPLLDLAGQNSVPGGSEAFSTKRWHPHFPAHFLSRDFEMGLPFPAEKPPP